MKASNFRHNKQWFGNSNMWSKRNVRNTRSKIDGLLQNEQGILQQNSCKYYRFKSADTPC